MKNVFIIILLILSGHIVKAQSGRHTNFGIKAGAQAAKLGQPAINWDTRYSWHAGILAHIHMSRHFAIQPELLFSTKGSNAQYSGLIYQEVKYNLNYLDVPVLAVFKLGDVGEIHLGGYASYLLNANITYKGDLANGASEIDKDNLKSFDYGFSGGMGANFGNVQVGARYNFGFVEIADSNEAKTVLGDAKNSCTQIFISFNLNSK